MEEEILALYLSSILYIEYSKLRGSAQNNSSLCMYTIFKLVNYIASSVASNQT